MRPAAHPGTLPLLIVLAVGSVACQPVAEDPAPADTTREGPQVVQEIHTEGAPEAIGPYSQAILVGSTLYLAGQIALDPTTGEMVGDGEIAAETHRVMQNLGAVLEAGGFTFDDVVQSQVFLADLEDFQAMNEVYGEYLSPPYPARATVEVAALHRDARVEIQFVAARVTPTDPGAGTR